MGKLLNWVILLVSWFLPRLRTVSQKYFKHLMRSSEECNCYTELLAWHLICISNWSKKIGMNICFTHGEISACFVEATCNYNNKELFYSPLQLASIVRATNWSVKSIRLSNFYNHCLYFVFLSLWSLLLPPRRTRKRAQVKLSRETFTPLQISFTHPLSLQILKWHSEV